MLIHSDSDLKWFRCAPGCYSNQGQPKIYESVYSFRLFASKYHNYFVMKQQIENKKASVVEALL